MVYVPERAADRLILLKPTAEQRETLDVRASDATLGYNAAVAVWIAAEKAGIDRRIEKDFFIKGVFRHIEAKWEDADNAVPGWPGRNPDIGYGVVSAFFRCVSYHDGKVARMPKPLADRAARIHLGEQGADFILHEDALETPRIGRIAIDYLGDLKDYERFPFKGYANRVLIGGDRSRVGWQARLMMSRQVYNPPVATLGAPAEDAAPVDLSVFDG